MSNLISIPELSKSLAANKKSFESVLPPHIKPEKFMRTVVGAVQNNPELMECSQDSVIKACQKCATDGLIPDGREAALVCYNMKDKATDRWIKAASYQPMIDGVLKKLRNSGQMKSISAFIVHEKDAFKFNPAMDEVPNHNPDWFGDRGAMVGVYAFCRLSDGSTQVEIMNLDQVEKIRLCSKSGNDKQTGKPKGIWRDWYEEKAKVACLKRLCKRLPSSADIEQLFDHDNEDYLVSQRVRQAAPIPQEGRKLAAYRPVQSLEQQAHNPMPNVDYATGEVLEPEPVQQAQAKPAPAHRASFDPTPYEEEEVGFDEPDPAAAYKATKEE